MAVQTRKERIDIRVTKLEKETIEKAAAAVSLSVSSYLISLAMKQAKKDLSQDLAKEDNNIYLTREEAIRFFELLNNPPVPNDNLKKLLSGVDIDKNIKL